MPFSFGPPGRGLQFGSVVLLHLCLELSNTPINLIRVEAFFSFEASSADDLRGNRGIELTQSR